MRADIKVITLMSAACGLLKRELFGPRGLRLFGIEQLC